MQAFYITTPIYYVNAKPHLGHAYTTIVADAMRRFQRMQGKDTYFLTGTDEHGDKIVEAAEKNGQQPQAYVDHISSLFRDLWPRLGVEHDRFIRTTEDAHKRVVSHILQKVYDAGDIYFGDYGGPYCKGCERFYTEKELEDGLCPQHRVAPEYIKEENYFFRMSRHQDWLVEHIKSNPGFIRPERYRGEVLSLLESGALDDLCISRPKSRLDWGIELPFDDRFVTYVWFDALINYLTALDYPEGEAFGRYWPQAQHLVAKDILKPHAVFWPTMLRAAGIEPYRRLNVHGYWLAKNTKMSKSLGNVVAPLDMADKYGLAAFRYFLLREMRFGNDASFSEEALVARLNADLANDLGNLFNRVLGMLGKYHKSVVPEPGPYEELDADVHELALEACANYRQLFENAQFDRALEALWELVRGLNKYVDDAQPWALFKAGDTSRLAAVLYTLLEGMRKSALHLWPVMPEAAEAMLGQLGLEFDPEKANLRPEAETWGLLPAGLTAAKTSNLFPRVEPEKTETKPETKPAKAKAKVEPAPEGIAFIEFEDFAKVDLRVGLVTAVQKHPDADKLYKVTVDLGEDSPRQVIAGIAEFYGLDELPGKQVVVVANLKPRKLRGLESRGMLLAVKDGGALRLLGPDAPVTPGRKVS